MTTLAEHIIVAGAENRPLMLEKSMYDSWASRIRLFIKGKKHGRMMLDSIDNAQQLQDDCDVQATNIILHGHPPDVYALVNHQEADKDIWDRVKMLMKGTENRGITTTSNGNVAIGPSRVVKCYNYLREGHIVRQCTQPKRPRNAAWLKEKLMLVEAQEAALQTDDVDAYDSDCDDLSLAKAALSDG
ncbi:integrase, catalytic region, zinc finger, CCHC-type containing protein [Tanacetum coccineum]